jgi:hypothetical protein
MQNDDQTRPGQPPIHTQLPDAIPPEDARKIVGERVPRGADYNSPPPRGAGKSMGSGLDDSVGGPGLGRDPAPRGAAGERDRDSRVGAPYASMQQGNAQGDSPQGGQEGGGRPDNGQQGNVQRAGTDGASRSEGLLPQQGERDGRYEVAEEVSLDQQSNAARRVGSMEDAAKGPHGDQLADAVARSLGKDKDAKS